MMRALSGLSLVLAMACGGPARSSRPPAPREAAPRPDVELPDARWGRVESPRFFVELALPDRAAWTVDDESGRWLVATHAPTHSTLYVRGFREGSVVGRAACEAEGRKWRPDLFGEDEAALRARRPLASPPGFDAEMGFMVRRSHGGLEGVAAASAARVRTCLLVAYVTRADGPGADRAVADRLALAAERLFPSITTRTIDDRVAPATER
jgi:hypothetical protein